MKAKEYFAKEINAVKDAIAEKNIEDLNERIKRLYIDFAAETEEICKRRGVKKDQAVASVVREQNIKWNSLCNLFEKELGFRVLKKDAFKSALQVRVPGLEDAMNRSGR